MIRISLDATARTRGMSSPTDSPSAPEPAPSTPPPSPPSAEAPPPAAVIVTEGKRTEREILLEEELRIERAVREQEQATRKDREQQICQLEDENFRLKGEQKAVVAEALRKPARRFAPVIRLEE